jgi:hydroxymethylpyrimidine pyrophosphatase-like HAD family hydrolase
MSFGDAENDCPMLDFAKYSFAMENGTDECKAHAKFVTKSNAEDGVAVAVEKYAL